MDDCQIQGHFDDRSNLKLVNDDISFTDLAFSLEMSNLALL
jgi:hypothetical protein